MKFTIDTNQANRYTRIYLLAVIISLTAQYVFWVVYGYFYPIIAFSDEQRIAVGLLFVLHLLLHWLYQYIPKRWMLFYLLSQAFVFLAIGLFAGNLTAITSPLIMPLLGEMVLVYNNLIWNIVLQVGFIALQVFCFRVIFGPAVFAALPQELLSITFSLPFYAALLLQSNLRRRAQYLLNELDMAHRQLAVYADQVEQLTLTAERARLARELHDTLAQGVAGIVLQLEALDAYMEQGNAERVGQIVTQIKSRARSALADSRQAIDDLRIVPDREGALLNAIREEAARFSTSTGIPCTLQLPETLILPTSLMEHVLRCTTESLANIARHAQADHIWITLRQKDGQLWLEIRDNGLGFDSTDAPPTGHYGLIGLRERARLIGGTLDIESAPGQGTTIRLHCPVNNMVGQR
jgi:NarL family two-component system sensor histidine kinase YdfH